MSVIFVTGTDTDVGKTVVSTLLTLGHRASYWKPVQTGSKEGKDSSFVNQFVAQDKICKESYVFQEPLSPNQAALLENEDIDFSSLVLPKFHTEHLVIEGAGGVYVPLCRKFFMIDLIQKLDVACVVVARSGLGTLNHTILTIKALQQMGIEIKGIVLNGRPHPMNRKDIEHHTGCRVILELDKMENINQDQLIQYFNQMEKVM